MAEFEISNVMGTITYQQRIDLLSLAETFEQRDEITSVNYKPTENHWLQTRFAPDSTYVSFYRSGKCSIVGATSSDQFEKIVQQVNKTMRELLEFEYQPTAEIKNIVATTELDSVPPLEIVATGLGLEQTEYEPEQFPAVIHRNGESVMIIFSDGKLICTGVAEFDRVSPAINDIINKIKHIDTH